MFQFLLWVLWSLGYLKVCCLISKYLRALQNILFVILLLLCPSVWSTRWNFHVCLKGMWRIWGEYGTIASEKLFGILTLNMYLLYDLAISLLDVNPREMKPHVHTELYINIHWSFTDTRQKWPKYPLIGEWINKMDKQNYIYNGTHSSKKKK